MNGYFEVKVHGEYFAQVGDKRELRGYDATFRLPNADEPLSIIKGKLLLPFLQKKDKQCVGVYTHYIDDIRCEGRRLDPNEIPIRFQNKEQLSEYIRYHKLPMDANNYSDLGKLRDHVRLAKEEPENFGKVYAKYMEKKDQENALFALNADILMNTNKPIPQYEGGTDSAPAPVETPTTAPKPKPKRTTKAKTKPEPESTPKADEVEELLS